MKVKLRLIGDKLNSDELLISAKNLQLGTDIYVEKFPITKDVGVMTILESFEEKENRFQVVIRDKENKELGRGNIFKLKIMTKEKEAIIIYNINKAYFEKKIDFYKVELLSGESVIDSYKLGCETEIYNIYSNLAPKGTISLD